jgi:hypothetical protein
MSGTIDFTYDERNDIVIFTLHWKIETKADVFLWYQQHLTYLKRFPEKKDVILVLDDFVVTPSIGVFWGEQRAKLALEMLSSFRVHLKSQAQFYTNTSGIKYNATTAEAATVEDAIAGILAARKKISR